MFTPLGESDSESNDITENSAQTSEFQNHYYFIKILKVYSIAFKFLVSGASLIMAMLITWIFFGFNLRIYTLLVSLFVILAVLGYKPAILEHFLGKSYRKDMEFSKKCKSTLLISVYIGTGSLTVLAGALGISYMISQPMQYSQIPLYTIKNEQARLGSRIVAGSMLTSELVNSANHGMFMTVRDINNTSSYGNMKENNNGNAKADKCYVFTYNHSSYSNTSRDEIIRVIHDSVEEFAKNRSIPIRMYLEGGTLIQSLRYGRIDPSAVDDVGMILRAPNPDGSRNKKQWKALWRNYRSLCRHVCRALNATSCDCAHWGYGNGGITHPLDELGATWKWGFNWVDFLLYKDNPKTPKVKRIVIPYAGKDKKCTMSGREFYCGEYPIMFLCNHKLEKYCNTCPMLPPLPARTKRDITYDVDLYLGAEDLDHYKRASKLLHDCNYGSFYSLWADDAIGEFEDMYRAAKLVDPKSNKKLDKKVQLRIKNLPKRCKKQMESFDPEEQGFINNDYVIPD